MLFIFSRSTAAWCRRHFKTLRSGLTNILEVEKIPWHQAFTAVPNFYCFRPTSSFIFRRMYAYMHISNCEQTIYELPLLPHNTAVKHFYTNQERCEMLTGYLSLERWPCDDWLNTLHIFVFGSTAPQWARTTSFTKFLDHTQRHTTVGKTPLEEWSALGRDLYLTTHNT